MMSELTPKSFIYIYILCKLIVTNEGAGESDCT